MAPVLWEREVSQMMWYLKSPTGREGGHRDAFEDTGCPVGLWNGEQGGVCLGVRLWCKACTWLPRAVRSHGQGVCVHVLGLFTIKMYQEIFKVDECNEPSYIYHLASTIIHS